jgi:hypothetical protein
MVNDLRHDVQTELQKLMQKDMDRKSFIKHVGIGFAGIIGITGAIKTLTSLNQPAGQHMSNGYGSSAYGGRKLSSNS